MTMKVIMLMCSRRRLVRLSASLADFSAGTRKWFDIPHLNHGGSKIREESVLVGAVGGHLGISGTSIEECLIGVEKSFLVLQIDVIVVVKDSGSHIIQWR